MKKILIILFGFIFVLTGCGKIGEDDVLSKFHSNIKNSYFLTGNLSILNNDEVYNYDVEVSYKKDNFYKVMLINQSNDYTQVILKNEDGVYILTPSLNKSFKFQSDWPYGNSQIYLLDSLFNDIKNDKNRKFRIEDKNYVFDTRVNYPNNIQLKKQTIYFDKKQNVKKIKVYDTNKVIKMEFNINDVDYNPTFKSNYFSVDSVMRTFNDEKVLESSSLDDSIIPFFIPTGTKLKNTEKIKMDDGERIIMTFAGEKSFLLVEETSNVMDEFTIIPTYGEPCLLMDTLGVMTDNSLTWSSAGVDYYLVGEDMPKDELIEIAQSINPLPSLK